MYGRNPRLPIDVLIENNTTEQNTSSTYIEDWKSRMKEAFEIAAAHAKRRREKARFQPLEVDGRVLVRNLN